jgi:hypothetical protein
LRSWARIGALEDEVKAKNARIAELHAEVDEARQLVEEMRQQVITNNDIVDGWIEAFGMTLGDDGLYHWEGVVQEWEKERNELQADYDRLQSLIRPQLDFWASRQKPEPGRPIAASASQQAAVREFRRASCLSFGGQSPTRQRGGLAFSVAWPQLLPLGVGADARGVALPKPNQCT